MTRITNFKGEFPRATAYNTPLGFACTALDVKLWHGSLCPFLEPKPVCELAEKYCTVQRHATDCCWIGSCDPCANILPLASTCYQSIVTSPTDVPRVVTDTDAATGTATDCECPPVISACPLGIPVPQGMPTADAGPECTEHGTLRRYLITYIREDCFAEGAPGALSTDIIVESCDTPVTLDNIPQPDDLCIDKIGIYRLETTWDTEKGYTPRDISAGEFEYGSGADLNHGGYIDTLTQAEWFLVAEVPVGTTTISDSLDSNQLGRTLTTWDFFPPPEGLQIGGINDNGQLVGWQDNILWLSERNAPHAWPDKWRLSLDDKIQSVSVQGNMIKVITDGVPYIISGDIDCKEGSCLAVRKGKRSLPICSKRSMVEYNGNTYWATKWGLARMDESGMTDITTKWLFEEDDWQQLDPSTMQGVIYNERYFFTSNELSGYFDITPDENSEGLVRLSTQPHQWITDNAGDLFFLHDGTIYEWDAGPGKIPFHWQSKVDVHNGKSRIAALKIVHCSACDPGTNVGHKTWVRLCRDGRDALHRKIPHSSPVRVKPGRGTNYRLTIRGEDCICEAHYAESKQLLVGGT